MQRLYALSGLISGIMILAICVLVIAQIVARPMGIVLPGADEFAIGAFVAAIFLGLPYTLSVGGHVRADVIVQLLSSRGRWVVAIIVHLVALAFVALFAYYAADLAWNSYIRKMRFQGLLGSPLWIPQFAMVVGLVLFGAAILHNFVGTLRHGVSEPSSHTLDQGGVE